MTITYIHLSGFLVETDSCYYLFDYKTGNLPPMNSENPIFVLSSHIYFITDPDGYWLKVVPSRK